ncbi:MAG: hypothetical protein ACE5LS_05380 [Thermoplasmata archaeon]
MDGVELIRETKTKAREEDEAHKDALARRPETLQVEVERAYRDLAGAYGHMKHGRALIDIPGNSRYRVR